MLRNLTFLSILLVSVSCLKKDPKNQPCDLEFETSYNQTSQSIVNFSSGLISLKKIRVRGTRSAGNAIDIEREWYSTFFMYYNNTPWSLNMDIPQGEYYDLKIGFSFRSESNPSWRMVGTALRNQQEIPFIFEIGSDLDFYVSTNDLIPFQKGFSYRTILQVNTDTLLEGISQSDLDAAMVYPFNSQDAILVTSTYNTALYSQIRGKLEQSLQLKIEE